MHRGGHVQCRVHSGSGFIDYASRNLPTGTIKSTYGHSPIRRRTRGRQPRGRSPPLAPRRTRRSAHGVYVRRGPPVRVGVGGPPVRVGVGGHKEAAGAGIDPTLRVPRRAHTRERGGGGLGAERRRRNILWLRRLGYSGGAARGSMADHPKLLFYHDGRHPLIYMYEPPITRQQYEQVSASALADTSMLDRASECMRERQNDREPHRHTHRQNRRCTYTPTHRRTLTHTGTHQDP